MAPQYAIYVYTAAGTLSAVCTDFLSVAVNRTVNAIDIAQFGVNSVSSTAPYIVYGAIVEVYRQDNEAGIVSTREFAGIIRGITTTYGQTTVITAQAVGINALLGDRIVAYKSGIANRSQFSAQPAETIMKTLYNYNLSTSATVANGRSLDGRLTGAAAATSGGLGNAMSFSCAGQNLLSALQEIQLSAGGDFALTYTAPATWNFVWYTGQLGTNKTATVILSLETGTVAKLTIRTDRITDMTAAVVAGQGEGSARVIVTRPASLPTGLDLREAWIDARNQKTTAEYTQLGDISLRDAERRRSTIQTEILQNAALRYGRDYFLGDLVTVYAYAAGNITQKVGSVSLSMSALGAESVNVGLISN
jgi:hypothetical protein